MIKSGWWTIDRMNVWSMHFFGMKHKIVQGFIIIYWKWFFGAHLSNLRNDKLNIRNRQIFYKQTDKSSICKISNENDMPFKLGNRWYSYNKFSIVYQFHRLYENTTYYLTYVTVPGTRVPLFKGSAEGNFD